MLSVRGGSLLERRIVLAGIAATSLVAIIGLWIARDDPSTPTADAAVAETTEPRATEATASSAPTMIATTTSPTSVATTTTSSPTTTTVDPDLLPTLLEGDIGLEVAQLQRMLNLVTGTALLADGIYGPETTTAVEAFQRFMELPATGAADHETRMLLTYLDGGRSTNLPTWPLPTIGDGGADGCQVAVIGDSLMSASQRTYELQLTEIGCAAAVDGVGGRSLAPGWQCRILQADGSRPLLFRPGPEPGNDTCAPSGLGLLQLWADAGALGDVVVVALGTNDAGLFNEARWIEHWTQAFAFAGERPVVLVTTQARPGSSAVAVQFAYTDAARRWCATVPRCVLADWALTPHANDPSSYYDAVHLRPAATEARASFISDVVAALLSGRPIPNPAPIPTPTTAMVATTTTIPNPPTTAATTTTVTTAPPTTASTTTISSPRSTTTTVTTTTTSATTTTVTANPPTTTTSVATTPTTPTTAAPTTTTAAPAN